MNEHQFASREVTSRADSADWLGRGEQGRTTSLDGLAAVLSNVERVMVFKHLPLPVLPSSCPCFWISDLPSFLLLS